MDRVETIRRGRRNYSRIWLKFIRIYDKDPEKMFCFFEGKDDVKYYEELKIMKFDRITINPARSGSKNSRFKKKIAVQSVAINNKSYKE